MLSHSFYIQCRSVFFRKPRRAPGEHTRVASPLHLNRLVGGGLVADGLLEDGVYRTQFETGIIRGLVSPTSRGPRGNWERSLFAGAYHDADEEAATIGNSIDNGSRSKIEGK